MIAFLLLCFAYRSEAQQLQLTFGSNGLQTISYGGTILEDTGANPADLFHIWHLSASDLQGTPLTGAQYTWGENATKRSWNSSSQTWTYQFDWGTLSTQFQQLGDSLNVIVTETNNAGSGIILNGASFYPLALHFPQPPTGFSVNQYGDNFSGPGVTLAAYGSAEIAAVAPDASKPLYSGFQSSGSANVYTALISSTAPDSLAGYLTPHNRPVSPGQTDTFTVSLRFAAAGTPLSKLAQDAYQSWQVNYPPTLNWLDRRAIGTVYLASSPTGQLNTPGGYPNNPRRYFNDSSSGDFDVATADGLARFQTKILQQANNNVQNLQRLNAQGAITWDIEGEQYPQDTSYVCSPDQLAQIAPEMESTISDASSPYVGMHLVDAYFQIMRTAGFRVGVCIRPQQFTLRADSTAAQVFLPDTQVVAQLIRKMQYAHQRWGATLFYVDSTVNAQGGTLEASIFQQVQATLPDSLIIPEETTPRHFAYTAPFASFIFHTDLGTTADVYSYYPQAFSANLVNDVDPQKLAQYQQALTDSVRRGDILMAHADYWQANNPTVVSIYLDAGVTGPPAPVAAQISWASPASIVYGTLLNAAQLNATANIPGTFAYSPAAGSMPLAGVANLSATFTPADSTHYTSVKATVSLTVNQAMPSMIWNTPADLPLGTALSATQLNATCSQGGAISYVPALGITLPSGRQTLTATCHPDDGANFSTATTSVTLTIVAKTPTIQLTIPDHYVGDAPFTLNTISTSPGVLTYTVTSGPAVLNGSQVSFTGPGSVSLQVNQQTAGPYAAATLQVTFLVLSDNLWLGRSASGLSSLALLGAASTPEVTDYAGIGLGAIATPLGMAFDGAGKLWVASSTGITRVDAADPASTPSIFSGGGLNLPRALAVDGLGQVWVANGNGSISSIAQNGALLSPANGFSTGLTSAPGGIAIDLSGNVWVTSSADNTISELVGAAAPVSPLSNALTNGSTGARP